MPGTTSVDAMAAGENDTAIIRLLLVFENRVFGEALAVRLRHEPRVAIGAVVASVDQAGAAVAGHDIHVVVADVHSGRDAAALTRLGLPGKSPPVVLIASTEGEGSVVEAMRAGVRAWVPRSESTEQLLKVIIGVFHGETWLPPRLLTAVLGSYSERARTLTAHQRAMNALTARERDVLAAMAEGCSRAEIATRLFLSPNTVRSHAQSILRKLGVNSSLAAVAIARRAGQVDDRAPDAVDTPASVGRNGPPDVAPVTPAADSAKDSPT